MILEACVESFEEAVNAETRGANRIELCDDLSTGGLTPSYALLESVKSKLNIPIMVMIRPRAGNFIYDSMELKQMKQNIDICKSLDVAGVVFGLLDDRNTIDVKNTTLLAEYASPLEITFHKAIDDTPDLLESVEILLGIKGITRILTSGGQATASEGAQMINKMSQAAGNRLKILAAGKITHHNLTELSGILHVDEFHGRKIFGDLK